MPSSNLNNRQIRRLVNRLLEYYSRDYLLSLSLEELLALLMKLFGFYLCFDEHIPGIYPGANFNLTKDNWEKFVFFLKLLFGYWQSMDERSDFATVLGIAAHRAGSIVIASLLESLAKVPLVVFLKRINYLLDLNWDTWIFKQSLFLGALSFFAFRLFRFLNRRKRALQIRRLLNIQKQAILQKLALQMNLFRIYYILKSSN